MVALGKMDPDTRKSVGRCHLSTFALARSSLACNLSRSAAAPALVGKILLERRRVDGMRITISTERLVSRQQNAYYEKDRKHSGARVDFNFVQFGMDLLGERAIALKGDVFILSTVSYSDRTLRAARRRFP